MCWSWGRNFSALTAIVSHLCWICPILWIYQDQLILARSTRRYWSCNSTILGGVLHIHLDKLAEWHNLWMRSCSWLYVFCVCTCVFLIVICLMFPLIAYNPAQMLDVSEVTKNGRSYTFLYTDTEFWLRIFDSLCVLDSGLHCYVDT